jgi:type II secretory pathway pseudopilin PulG
MKTEACLSCIEIMTIVVVLGVIGGAVAPGFTEARTGSKISALVEGLQEMRFHLDLYRAQHEGRLPATDSFALFEVAMTSKTGDYGPYVERIPINPFNNLNMVRFDGEPAGSNKAGWRLDTKTGLFQADNDAEDAAL